MIGKGMYLICSNMKQIRVFTTGISILRKSIRISWWTNAHYWFVHLGRTIEMLKKMLLKSNTQQKLNLINIEIGASGELSNTDVHAFLRQVFHISTYL